MIYVAGIRICLKVRMQLQTRTHVHPRKHTHANTRTLHPPLRPLPRSLVLNARTHICPGTSVSMIPGSSTKENQKNPGCKVRAQSLRPRLALLVTLEVVPLVWQSQFDFYCDYCEPELWLCTAIGAKGISCIVFLTLISFIWIFAMENPAVRF